MNIVVINGSSYSEKSMTDQIVKWFLDSMNDINYKIFYPEKDDIMPCKGCNTCFNNSDGKCLINDDMSKYIEAIKNSDLVIFASPIYINFISARLKSVIERMRPLSSGKYSTNKYNNFYPVPRDLKEYKFFIVCTCGFPEIETFASSKMFFETITNLYDNYTGLGGIYIPAFKAISLGFKDLLKKIKHEVKKVGFDIQNGKKVEIYKEWLSKKDFMDYMKSYDLIIEN